jgi:hypothetical protein
MFQLALLMSRETKRKNTNLRGYSCGLVVFRPPQFWRNPEKLKEIASGPETFRPLPTFIVGM